jgi:hypothetical protein
MQDVRTTVLDSLRGAGYGSYSQYAEPVITALEGRERDISGVLIEYATRQGMTRGQVEQALAQAGMAIPGGGAAAVPSTPQAWAGPTQSGATPAAPQESSGDPVAAALRDIQQTLSGLVQFARDNGYSG